MATNEKCGRCVYRVDGICRGVPPSPFPMPDINPITGDQRLKIVSISPPVGEDDSACSLYKPKLEIMA